MFIVNINDNWVAFEATMSIAGNYGQVDTAVMIQSIHLMFRHNYGHYQISASSAKWGDGVNSQIPQAETAKEWFLP